MNTLQTEIIFDCCLIQVNIKQQIVVKLEDHLLTVNQIEKIVNYNSIQAMSLKTQNRIIFYLIEQKIKLQVEKVDFVLIKNYLKHRLPQRNFKKIYKIEQILSSNTTSQILLCKSHLNNQLYAVKFQNLTNTDQQMREIEILYHLSKNPHHNIISFVEYFIEDSKLIIVFPYLEGGTLFSLIKKFQPLPIPPSLNLLLLKALLKALTHLHKQGIIHRDLKLDNIMLDDENNPKSVQIIDFGLSTFNNVSDYQLVRCGTIGYIAPEILCDEPYDQKCDVYSLGQIFYVMVTGRPTFQKGKSLNTLTKLAKSKSLQNNLEMIKNPELKQLLVQMTDLQKQRLTSQECLDSELFKKRISISQKIQKLQFEELKTPF